MYKTMEPRRWLGRWAVLFLGLLTAACASKDKGGDIPLEQQREMVIISGLTVKGSGPANTMFALGRTVYLSPFKIAKYETTYELWYLVRTWGEANGYTFANPGKEGSKGVEGAEPGLNKTEPVVDITWRDAVVWCNAYSEKSNLGPVYYHRGRVIKNSKDAACDSAVAHMELNGYRLPTEAEWESAARGGDVTNMEAWSMTYPGGAAIRDLRNVAWYVENTEGTHYVGGKKPNQAGIFDMSGNVWEWCFDWYDSLPVVAVTNPWGARTGKERVVRGGGWNSYPAYCTVFARRSNLAGGRNVNLGFRVVTLAPPGLPEPGL